MDVAVARALKSSLRREFLFQQALGEEILRLNANNVVVVGGDDFSVDELLDFSNGELFQHASDHYEQQQEEYTAEKDSLFFSSQSQDDNSNSNSIFSCELAVPGDDLAELEWVSHYVDDSPSELSLLNPIRPQQAKAWPEPKPTPCTPEKTPGFVPLETKVPAKTRTKSTRKPNTRACLFTTSSWVQVEQRRCSHCQVQKTPQWRSGPLGPKTLCNACGVRYKSGRLFAEYRPACSPSFSSEIHSNSHRKVLEMRKRKEMLEPNALASLLHSC